MVRPSPEAAVDGPDDPQAARLSAVTPASAEAIACRLVVALGRFLGSPGPGNPCMLCLFSLRHAMSCDQAEGGAHERLSDALDAVVCLRGRDTARV
jgi:hypothetical protein